MKKILKITVSVILLLSLCFALASCCKSCRDDWYPCNQPGTYWETTDSSISFYIWKWSHIQEIDSDPLYERAWKCTVLRGGDSVEFLGRGQITYEGKATDVLVLECGGVDEDVYIYFYSADIIDFYLSDDWLSKLSDDRLEEQSAEVEERLKADEKQYSYLCLKIDCKSSDKAILTVVDWDGVYGAFESKAFEIGTEFELHRIDPS
ncbi:MAG: hypothetical protein IJX38_02185 [Clostridia bacterium]|nr:hypothetical protein [Clostridia bacterium]MBQ8371737.1 hypothetical protein [Clostridia bacterium]